LLYLVVKRPIAQMYRTINKIAAGEAAHREAVGLPARSPTVLPGSSSLQTWSS